MVTSPVEGATAPGTYSTFLLKMEQIVPKLVQDCWENGPPEHRVSISTNLYHAAATQRVGIFRKKYARC